ncbi:MAG: DUF2807 domain-containing protein, partial [Pedobacter sp.]
KTVNIKFLFFAIALTTLLSSCTTGRMSADGNTTTISRKLDGFHSIQSSGATPVYISYGPQFKVEVKGSSNLLPGYKTEVTGNVLYAGFKNASIKNNDIKLYVTLPSLKGIEILGSGDTRISGNFPSEEDLSIRISGSAKVNVDDAFTRKDVRVAILGSGNADLSKVNCQNADVKISGSGDIRLEVSNLLKARITGTGNVYVKGSPKTDTEISGPGKIISVN